MAKRTFKVWRGDATGGEFKHVRDRRRPRHGRARRAPPDPGARRRNDLALRWNCKAGKCGSCSEEINGKPRLVVHDAHEQLRRPTRPITVQPLKTFPLIKDLVTDVSWNYEQNKRIPPFKPQAARRRRHLPDVPGGRRSRAGVPQVHRVLPVPGRLPRPARPRTAASSEPSSARAS